MTQKSRRDFIRASSLLVASGAVAGGLSIARTRPRVWQRRDSHWPGRLWRLWQGRCGQMLSTTSGPVRLVAMADVFGDRIQAAFRQLKSRHADKLDVPRERRFIGLDAYRKLLASDLDLVILATPPGFRPLHFEAAVAAGKHVFLEKPVAVDAPGVRRVLQAGATARQKGLAVAVGLRHRHEPAYRETIAQLQNGVIGDRWRCASIATVAVYARVRRCRTSRNWNTSCAIGAFQLAQRRSDCRTAHPQSGRRQLADGRLSVMANAQGGRDREHETGRMWADL